MTPLSPSGSWSVDGVGGVLASAASSLGRTSRRRGPPTRRRLPEVAAVRRRAGVERARPGARNATSAAVAVSRCVEPTHTNTKP